MKINNSFIDHRIEQLTNKQLVIAYGVPSVVAIILFRIILPLFVNGGANKFTAWAIISTIFFFAITVTGLTLSKIEGHKMDMQLRKRISLKKLTGPQWFIGIAMMMGGSYIAINTRFMVPLFSKISSIPDYFPFWLDPMINPLKTDMSKFAGNYSLYNNQTFIQLMCMVIFLYVTAEMVYYRAYLLPKMERLGKRAWILNGVFFTSLHLFEFYLFPIILFASITTAFTYYVTKSIFPGIAFMLTALFMLAIFYISPLIF